MTQKLMKIWVLFLLLYPSLVETAAAMASRPNPDPNAPPPPGWVSWVPLMVMVFVFYFFLIRPQSRQRKERELMLANLKKGDKIITQGGFFGTIVNVTPGYFEVKLNEDTKVRVQRTAVVDIQREEKPKVVEPTVVK